MSKKSVLSLSAAAFLAIGLAACGTTGMSGGEQASSSAAMPAEMSAEDTFLRYREAVWAEALCENKTFDTDQQQHFYDVIDRKTDNAIGSAGKRLTLDSQAESKARDLVFKDGCKGPQVTELRNLYQTELASGM